VKPTLAHTGVKSAVVDDISGVSDSFVRTPDLYIPAGAYLNFDHLFEFDTSYGSPSVYYDGGVVEYSLNSGSSWTDAASLMDTSSGVSYGGTITTEENNPLGGRSAFVGVSHGYVGTRLILSTLAGQTVRFRWRQGTGSSVGSLGWSVDDIRIYICRAYTRAQFDFNSDGATDIAIYRPSQGTWYNSSTGSITHYGLGGDLPVPGDYNGDGKTDIAVYRPSTGTWYIKDQFYANYGIPSDQPIPADYNGDGKTDIAVYRPSAGTWYVKDLFYTNYGLSGDIPVPGDYNGDGRTDVAVYRPSAGTWYVKDLFYANYGLPGDIPIPGDYNGDGVTDIAVYRPSAGTWYVKDQFYTNYGLVGDIAIPGDYNGDGITDIAVYRPSAGTWYIKNSSYINYGILGDIPLPELGTGKASTAP
jgi:hypothetical protein